MATNERPPRHLDAPGAAPDAAVGIAHLTVVPANFDPEDADGRQPRSGHR